MAAPERGGGRLGLAFMRSRPADAARVLEALDNDAVVALFDQVPVRIGAPVLAAMVPRAAARVLAPLDDGRVAALMTAMPTQAAVALLRHVEPVRRRALTGSLPTATALASTLLLGQLEDSVGAWVDPDVLAIGGAVTAADAVDRLRAATSAHAVVVVVDEDRRVFGTLELTTLLRAPGLAHLSTLMRRDPPTLAAGMPLAAALSDAAWHGDSMLTVVDAQRRLLGLLTRDALQRAWEKVSAGHGTDAATQGLPALAALSYWQAMSGLLHSLLGLLPRVPALAGPDDER